MFSLRKVLILVLLSLPAFILPGITQDTQEAFEEKLLASCDSNDLPTVKTLITEHRLWVKPVVDYLIVEYIKHTLADEKSLAEKEKTDISLLSQTFQNIYGEKCLTIGSSYLEKWDDHDLLKKAIADSLNTIAIGLRTQADKLEEAISVYHDVLNRYEEIGDERGRADVLGGMGYIYWFLDPDSCHHYYLKALEAREHVDDRQLTASTFNGLGSLNYRQLYNLDKAVSYYSSAASLREEIGDWAGLGNTLAYLSLTYESLGDLEKANECFLHAYEINQKTGNLANQAMAMIHLGTNSRELGKYPEAIAYLKNAMGIYKEMEHPVGMADVHIQMGLVHINIGDYERAIKEALEADRLFSKSNDAWGLAGAYNNIGIILQDADRPGKAVEYYEKALGIYEELDDQDNIWRVLNNLGTIYFNQKDYSRAIDYQARSLVICRRMENESNEVTCLLNLANTQNRLGKLDEALVNYELALGISRSNTLPEIEWKVLVGIGENYKLQGDYPTAIEYNEQGLEIVEEMRKDLQNESDRSSYMARERFAFEEIIHLFGELHQKEPDKGLDLKAFEYAQRSKSRSFLDQIAVSGSEVEKNAGQLSANPTKLPEIQNKCLEKNEVFLEYSMGDSCSYLWVITKDKYQMVPLPKRQMLMEQIETFRFALLNPSEDNKQFLLQSGSYLYDNLVKPAETYFPKKSQLIILPDGILNYLPFEVLITSLKGDPGNSYSSLPYLIKQYPISYGQSSSVMKLLIEDRTDEIKSKEKPSIVAFGDPVYEKGAVQPGERESDYNRLIYSGEEVAKIGAYFEEGNSNIYIREEASEDAVKKQGLFGNTSHIHFATHGIIDEDDPSRSSLILSQVNKISEDGYLMASEIINLEMDAELVVLSACQTGLGKMIRGEGVIGLSRAFMYAGTPSLIMSLWSVSDESTSILMERFYENLIRKGLPKAEALRLARISMIKDEKYAHPFFWAPFVLTGDWQ